jgi:hypothetical protein
MKKRTRKEKLRENSSHLNYLANSSTTQKEEEEEE